MSGHPYPAGVDRICEIIAAQERLRAEIQELTPKVKRLEAANAEHDRLCNEFDRLLDQMDLAGPGNAGFSSRMNWFLTAMRGTLKEK